MEPVLQSVNHKGGSIIKEAVITNIFARQKPSNGISLGKPVIDVSETSKKQHDILIKKKNDDDDDEGSDWEDDVSSKLSSKITPVVVKAVDNHKIWFGNVEFLTKLINLESIYQILEDNDDGEIADIMHSSYVNSLSTERYIEPTQFCRLTRKLLEIAPYVSIILARCDTLINHDKIVKISEFRLWICRALILCANEYQEISLRLFRTTWKEYLIKNGVYDYSMIIEFVTLIVLTIRDTELAQDFLLAVFPYRRALHKLKTANPMLSDDAAQAYFETRVLGESMNYLSDVRETCPCDWNGNFIKKEDSEPLKPILQQVKVIYVPKTKESEIRTRSIKEHSLRTGDHLRLQSSSSILDIVVKRLTEKKIIFTIQQRKPKDLEKVFWNLYECSSTTTYLAMIKAVQIFVQEQFAASASYSHILNPSTSDIQFGGLIGKVKDEDMNEFLKESNFNFNESQVRAIKMAINNTTSLVWGPPGTGKTTVVVQIILSHLTFFSGRRILVTASTHNATDNILEKFLEAVHRRKDGDSIVDLKNVFRIASDSSKVQKNLHKWIVNPGYDLYGREKHEAMRQANNKLKSSSVVFSTSSGSGLGLLKDCKLDFKIVIVDEASQLTESNALIPIAKKSQRLILVGDHHQLRATTSDLGKVYAVDTSLFERLYTNSPESSGASNDSSMPIVKSMLQVQYRMNPRLSHFPSKYFYKGELVSGLLESDRVLPVSKFEWPIMKANNGRGHSESKHPAVFIPCTEKETSGASKANIGQSLVVLDLIRKLRSVTASSSSTSKELQITVLTPYSLQATILQNKIKEQRLEVEVETIDGFQGRESDIIIFSTVRCNDSGVVGFLNDTKRMNVALTRAKFGLIVIGCEKTLQNTHIWKQWLLQCQKVYT